MNDRHGLSDRRAGLTHDASMRFRRTRLMYKKAAKTSSEQNHLSLLSVSVIVQSVDLRVVICIGKVCANQNRESLTCVLAKRYAIRRDCAEALIVLAFGQMPKTKANCHEKRAICHEKGSICHEKTLICHSERKTPKANRKQGAKSRCFWINSDGRPKANRKQPKE